MDETTTTRVKVTDEGVVIPREWFADVDEVELRRENGRVVVDPVRIPKNDPVWNLGKYPVDLDGPTDVSVNHDKYVYDDLSG